MKSTLCWIKAMLLAAVLWQNPGLCADSAYEFTITMGEKSVRLTRDQLLQSKDLETLVVSRDPAYEYGQRTYQVVAMSKLLETFTIDADAMMELRSTDGFSSVLSAARLLTTGPHQAKAYLAIEPAEKWPPLKPVKDASKPTPGPFYLVWSRPELSNIGREEWPFQIISLEIKLPLKKQYPKIFPKGASIPPAVKRGFEGFVKNCFTCHTLNQQGASQLGPDLNWPLSPTEYLRESALRGYVRNPQAVRHWPQSRMTPFPLDILSENELSDIVTYLKHMAKHRDKPRP